MSYDEFERKEIVIDFPKTVDANGNIVETTPEQQEHYANKLKELLVTDGYFDFLEEEDGSLPSITDMKIRVK